MDTQKAAGNITGTSPVSITKELLIEVGLIRDFRGSWQWAMQPGRSWRYTSSEASAVEQGVIMYNLLPPSERITMAERTSRFDALYDAQLEAAYGSFTYAQLIEMRAALTDCLTGLQKTAKREFNGNGGRRSGPAMAAEGARDLGTEKMRLDGYIRRKFEEAVNVSPATSQLCPPGMGLGEISAEEMQMRKSEEEIPFKVGALLHATYEEALNLGYSVVIADKDGIYEVAPDRSRKFLKATDPWVKVQKGRKYIIPSPFPATPPLQSF